MIFIIFLAILVTACGPEDESCSSTCDWRTCGYFDGCYCGNCSDGYDCVNFFCQESGSECSCQDRECGPDGCGGTCGYCSGLDKCVAGRCECEPDCSGKQCGSDGCGGICGECSDNATCDSNGQCVIDDDCIVGEKKCGLTSTNDEAVLECTATNTGSLWRVEDSCGEYFCYNKKSGEIYCAECPRNEHEFKCGGDVVFQCTPQTHYKWLSRDCGKVYGPGCTCHVFHAGSNYEATTCGFLNEYNIWKECRTDY